MNREETLMTALQYVTKDRNANYQEPEDNFWDIAHLWNWLLSEKLKSSISLWEVAIMSAMIKIARLKGNPYHEDNWVDIAGYAACGEECAEKEHREAEAMINDESWKQLELNILYD